MKKISSILALILLGLTLSFGQQARDTAGPAPVSQTQDARSDHNWGWIGLFGLLGLAGLLGRKKDVSQRDSDRDQRSRDIRRVA
jgi:MYXO-CTERM domain-containing protein